MNMALMAWEQKVRSLQDSELTMTVTDGKVTVNEVSLQRSFLHAMVWHTSCNTMSSLVLRP